MPEHHQQPQSTPQSTPQSERERSGRVTYSPRGFARLRPFRTAYGHVLRVYESSAASAPHLWLAVDGDASQREEIGQSHVHLTFEQAQRLVGDLQYLMAHHYQVSGESPSTPEEA